LLQSNIIQNSEPRKQKTDKINLLSVVCCLLSISILAGCATSRDIGRIQWDINELKSETKNIRQKYNTLESQIPGQEKEFNKRLKAVEEEQKTTASAVSDLLIKMQALTAELQVMTGRLEEVRYFSEKNLKELTEGKDILTARLKELEIAVNELKDKHAQPKSGEKPELPEKSKEKEKVSKRDVKDIYIEAYQAYQADQLEDAREKFQAILRNYPENEYSDNARFWIGESYYKEKNYEGSILAYEELLRKNTQSDKVPSAMLKQGLAFYELNDKKTGRIILEKLIERFPDSKEAALAKKKISSTKK